MLLALALSEMLLALALFQKRPLAALYMAVAVYSALHYDPTGLYWFVLIAFMSDCARALMVAEAAFDSMRGVDRPYGRTLLSSFALLMGFLAWKITVDLDDWFGPWIAPFGTFHRYGWFVTLHVRWIISVAFFCGALGLAMWWLMEPGKAKQAHGMRVLGYVWIAIPGALSRWSIPNEQPWGPIKQQIGQASTLALLLYTLGWLWTYRIPALTMIHAARKIAAPAIRAMDTSLMNWLLVMEPPRIPKRLLNDFKPSVEGPDGISNRWSVRSR